MPIGAGLGAIFGGIASGIGSIFGASAGNSVKNVPLPAPQPVNSSLNNQYLGMLSGLTGSSGNTLNNFITNGYSALPQWGAMLNAAQSSIKQGQQNLNEQFASQGLRYSSPMMNADANYQSQVQSQWLAQLAQMQSQSFQQQIQSSQFGLGLASAPATATYAPWQPVVGQNSVVGTGLQAGGSNIATIALLSQLGML